jgi:hypothetical protein
VETSPPVVVTTTTAAPTTTTTKAATTTTTTSEPIPEASGDPEGSAEQADMDTVDVDINEQSFGTPPVTGELQEEIIEEKMEKPAVVCEDFIINCAEYNNSQYRICDVRPGDQFYEMYRPIQDSCRQTCGFCDENAACKALKEFCHEADVLATCPGTCAGL